MNNGLGLDDLDYDKIKSDVAYFRGRVVSELQGIKKELVQQSQVDNKITQRLNELPCNKHLEKIKYALLLIAVLFLLLGADNLPLIMKFFGF